MADDRFPLADLIHSRMADLGLDSEQVGFRLGYKNPAKAGGRIQALCEGHLNNRKSQAALSRLAVALEIPNEVVDEAVQATEQAVADLDRERQEQTRKAWEDSETKWRAEFKPHAVIQTKRTRPSQITLCALSGGPERWLVIKLDAAKHPASFIQQILDALPRKLQFDDRGVGYVPLFGTALGFYLNYSPDRCVRCSLEGDPVEFLPAAYRHGHTQVDIAGRDRSPTMLAAAGLSSNDRFKNREENESKMPDKTHKDKKAITDLSSHLSGGPGDVEQYRAHDVEKTEDDQEDNEPDVIIDMLREKGLPITRENYIALNWGDAKPPGSWTAEDETDLPDELQDWSQFD